MRLAIGPVLLLWKTVPLPLQNTYTAFTMDSRNTRVLLTPASHFHTSEIREQGLSQGFISYVLNMVASPSESLKEKSKEKFRNKLRIKRGPSLD